MQTKARAMYGWAVWTWAVSVLLPEDYESGIGALRDETPTNYPPVKGFDKEQH